MTRTLGSMPITFGNIQPGQEIGRCQIIREIGRGGMGAVYLASHKTLRIDVALKILSPELAQSNPTLADRFIREAQMAARIRHPNVVSVMDADQDKNSELFYIIQEFMAGGTLSWHLRNGPLPEKRTLSIMMGIGQALAVAEEVGIIHRDIKPDNILLDSRQVPKLADLGLAKHALDSTTSLTMGGAFMGTPAYMSPEQARDAKNVTTQDDIYSLGATFFECLTGAPPFTGDTPYNVMSALLTRPTPRSREVNPAVSEPMDLICYKMMAKVRADRYPDAKSLLLDFEKVQSGSTSGWKHLAAYQLPKNAGQPPPMEDTQTVARRLGVQTDESNRYRTLKQPRSLPPPSHLNQSSKNDTVFVTMLLLTIGATALSIGILFFGNLFDQPTIESVHQKVASVTLRTPTHSATRVHPTHVPRAPAVEDQDKPVRTVAVDLTPVPNPSPITTLPPKAVTAVPFPIPAPIRVTVQSPVPTVSDNPAAPTAPPIVSNDQPSPSPFPPITVSGIPTPLPLLSDIPITSFVPDTAFSARYLAAQLLPSGPPGRLLGIVGERDRNSPIPTMWTLIFFDSNAKRHARYITVNHGRPILDRDYWIGVRLEYKPNEIYNDSELTIDSNQALKTAFDLYPDVSITGSSITLTRESTFVPPVVWTIGLWKKDSDGDQKRFATVTVKASEDGGVITNKPND